MSANGSLTLRDNLKFGSPSRTGVDKPSHGSVDSDSKLPQMACNKESAEKSADPEGEFFDYRRKNSLFF